MGQHTRETIAWATALACDLVKSLNRVSGRGPEFLRKSKGNHQDLRLMGRLCFVFNNPSRWWDRFGANAITIGPFTFCIPGTTTSEVERNSERLHEAQHRADWLSGLPGWKKEQRAFAAEIPYLQKTVSDLNDLLPHVDPNHPVYSLLRHELDEAIAELAVADGMVNSDDTAKDYWNDTGRRWYQKPVQ